MASYRRRVLVLRVILLSVCTVVETEDPLRVVTYSGPGDQGPSRPELGSPVPLLRSVSTVLF